MTLGPEVHVQGLPLPAWSRKNAGRRPSERLTDTRTGKNTQHSMLALLRQGVYGRIAGYEDTKDNAVRLQLFALAYNLANFLRRPGRCSLPSWPASSAWHRSPPDARRRWYDI